MVGGRARQPRQRPGAVDYRAAALALQPGREPVQRGARLAAVDGTAASAACVGVEQETAATSSISVRSVWCPTEAMTGTRSSATVRHSVSSQNANRSATEPPPRATTIDLDLRARRQVLQRARDRRRGAPVLDGREGPDHAARPAAPAQAGEDVVARLAALAGDDADAARQRRARQPLLRLAQALGVERAAQPLELGEEVASPATRSPTTAKENDGDAVREPG